MVFMGSSTIQRFRDPSVAKDVRNSPHLGYSKLMSCIPSSSLGPLGLDPEFLTRFDMRHQAVLIGSRTMGYPLGLECVDQNQSPCASFA
jgi:hypothetical protein